MPRRNNRFYDLLEVGPTATSRGLEHAYGRVKQRLEDKAGRGDQAAANRLAEVEEAWVALSDPDGRRLYDRFGEDAFVAGFDRDAALAELHGRTPVAAPPRASPGPTPDRAPGGDPFGGHAAEGAPAKRPKRRVPKKRRPTPAPPPKAKVAEPRPRPGTWDDSERAFQPPPEPPPAPPRAPAPDVADDLAVHVEDVEADIEDIEADVEEIEAHVEDIEAHVEEVEAHLEEVEAAVEEIDATVDDLDADGADVDDAGGEPADPADADADDAGPGDGSDTAGTPAPDATAVPEPAADGFMGDPGSTARVRMLADGRLEAKIAFRLACTGGTGEVRTEGNIWEVPVPENTRTGSQFTDGDLTIVYRVQPDARLFPHGDHDLRTEIELSAGQAIRRAPVYIPTLEGDVQLTVPEDAKDGQLIQLAGRGLRKPDGERGVLWVTLKIVGTSQRFGNRIRLGGMHAMPKKQPTTEDPE